MAKGTDQTTTILGIAAIVLGVLILVGTFTLGDLVPVLGVLLVIAGVLILLDVVKGSRLAAVVFLVLGVLLLVGFFPVPGALLRVIEIAVAVVLLVYGILLVR